MPYLRGREFWEPTLENIEERQNQRNFLRLRAAIYKTYSTPKTVFTIVFYLTLILAVVTIANALFALKWDTVIACMGGCLILVELLYRSLLSSQLNRGAILGDMYDLELYGVPLPPQRVNEQISIHEIVDLSRGIELMPFINWYTSSSRFPREKQVFICQFTNASWDFYLRRSLQYWTLLGVIFYLLILAIVPLYMDLYFREALIKVFIPGLPFALLLLNLYIDSREAVAKLQGLKNNTEQAIRAPSLNSPKELIYANQENLFRHRQSAFPIPNIIHNLLKQKTKSQVDECLNALAEKSL